MSVLFYWKDLRYIAPRTHLFHEGDVIRLSGGVLLLVKLDFMGKPTVFTEIKEIPQRARVVEVIEAHLDCPVLDR